MKGKRVDGGNYYRRRPDGRLVDASPGDPDVIICRRVADFPRGVPPLGAGVVPCTRCLHPIAFNPARTYSVPLVCMQCGGIRPLPIDPSS